MESHLFTTHTHTFRFTSLNLLFLFGTVRWFRGSKDASDDLESGVFGSHLAASILRHGSLKGRRGDGIGRSLQRVRRRVERRLGRIGLGKGKKVVGGVEEATGSCKYLEFLPNAKYSLQKCNH